MKEEIANAVEATRARLQTIRATLTDKAAVVGTEVKETVEGQLQAIEAGLNKAKADLEQGTDEARLQAALGAMEARDRWQAIESALTTHLQKVKTGGQEQFDKLRVQAELERATAEAAIAARKEEAKKWFAQGVETGDKALNDVASRLKKAVSDSLEKLKSL